MSPRRRRRRRRLAAAAAVAAPPPGPLAAARTDARAQGDVPRVTAQAPVLAPDGERRAAGSFLRDAVAREGGGGRGDARSQAPPGGSVSPPRRRGQTPAGAFVLARRGGDRSRVRRARGDRVRREERASVSGRVRRVEKPRERPSVGARDARREKRENARSRVRGVARSREPLGDVPGEGARVLAREGAQGPSRVRGRVERRGV